MTLTLRQSIAVQSYRRGVVTQARLAAEWGITQSAVSQRLTRARLAGVARYSRAVGRRIKLRALSIDFGKGD